MYAFPTEGAFRGQLKVGFRDLFPVAKVYRPLLPGLRRRRGGDTGLELRDVSGFDARFDGFAAGRHANGLSVARDAAYLQWRYADHPSGARETIACERNGELRAYCVLKVEHEPAWATPGYVVDLQAVPGAAEDARRLLEGALARLRERGARVAVAWMPPNGAERDALAATGFSPFYGAAWRRLSRPRFVDRFIAFDARRNGRSSGTGRELWAVAPGDADYM